MFRNHLWLILLIMGATNVFAQPEYPYSEEQYEEVLKVIRGPVTGNDPLLVDWKSPYYQQVLRLHRDMYGHVLNAMDRCVKNGDIHVKIKDWEARKTQIANRLPMIVLQADPEFEAYSRNVELAGSREIIPILVYNTGTFEFLDYQADLIKSLFSHELAHYFQPLGMKVLTSMLAERNADLVSNEALLASGANPSAVVHLNKLFSDHTYKFDKNPFGKMVDSHNSDNRRSHDAEDWLIGKGQRLKQLDKNNRIDAYAPIIPLNAETEHPWKELFDLLPKYKHRFFDDVKAEEELLAAIRSTINLLSKLGEQRRLSELSKLYVFFDKLADQEIKIPDDVTMFVDLYNRVLKGARAELALDPGRRSLAIITHAYDDYVKGSKVDDFWQPWAELDVESFDPRTLALAPTSRDFFSADVQKAQWLLQAKLFRKFLKMKNEEIDTSSASEVMNNFSQVWRDFSIETEAITLSMGEGALEELSSEAGFKFLFSRNAININTFYMFRVFALDMIEDLSKSKDLAHIKQTLHYLYEAHVHFMLAFQAGPFFGPMKMTWPAKTGPGFMLIWTPKERVIHGTKASHSGRNHPTFTYC